MSLQHRQSFIHIRTEAERFSLKGENIGLSISIRQSPSQRASVVIPGALWFHKLVEDKGEMSFPIIETVDRALELLCLK